jgi:serine/threonine protein kinase
MGSMETAALSALCAGVPVRISDRERTAPIAMDTRCAGPNRADLDELAQGQRDELEIGGRYRLDSLLGAGGMAKVFCAEQLALGRSVAVKVLDDTRGDRHNAVRRFMSEARITAGLRHPNVVDVIDFGSTPEGLVYLVMERLDGEDLRQTIKREGPLPWARVRALLLQICAGLAAAHELGVVHRDLKPSNCFRIATDAGEQVKLLDFGIAISTAETTREDRVTAESNVVGTPEYMSPEQARGDEVDARTDIYALGVILGELLTGKVPFTGKSASKVIAAHIYEPVPSLQALAGSTEIDADIEALYRRALSKASADRFASARDFAAAIAAIPAHRELIAPPRSRWSRAVRGLSMAAALVAAGLGVGVFIGQQGYEGPVACELAR